MAFSDALARRQEDAVRECVSDAIRVLVRLRREQIPADLQPLIPGCVQATMTGEGGAPTPDELESAWRVIVGWSVAVADAQQRQALWLLGFGVGVRKVAAVMDISASQASELEAGALAALGAWLARHGG